MSSLRIPTRPLMQLNKQNIENINQKKFMAGIKKK